MLLSGAEAAATPRACSQECAVTPKDTDILDESLTFLSTKWVQWNPLVVLLISPYTRPRIGSEPVPATPGSAQSICHLHGTSRMRVGRGREEEGGPWKAAQRPQPLICTACRQHLRRVALPLHDHFLSI